MDNPYCKNCDFEKSTNNGNCIRYKPQNGFAIRCAPPWITKKYNPIELYCSMINADMKKKRKVNYIDLYAGPGKCFERYSGKIVDGSPLIALRYEFNNLYLNDINPDNVKALSFRTQQNTNKVTIYNKDTNLVAREINEKLSDDSINFCFIDPGNRENLKYDTIKQISRNRTVDLLISFVYGLDYRWAVHSTEKKIDEFFGTDKWRFIEEKYKSKDIIFRAHALMELYIEQLNKIDYLRPPEGAEYKNIFPIHNTRHGTLHYLIFTSKHKQGYDFCKRMRPYTKPQ